MGFVRTHQPCPDCGSSDALSINDDGSTRCFSCDTFTPSKDSSMTVSAPVAPSKPPAALPADSYIGAIHNRRISMSAAEKYGVTQDDKGTLYFPYADKDGVVIAYKKHPLDKNILTYGAWQEAEPLFGMSKFNKGCAKSVMVTEGEADCLAAYQMNGHKWPVVSIRGGAASAAKDFKAAYEWLDSFDTIVVCFDNDEAGKAAAKKVCDVFGSKIKLMKLEDGFKDACDYLKENKTTQFMQRYWQAEQHVPDGIIPGSTLWDLVSAPMAPADCLYPWEGLNKLTYGIRKGEMITLTAGSGLGKSQLLREITYHVLKNTEDNIGLLFLEESVKKTALSLMSIAANTPLHLPDNDATDETRQAAFADTLGTGRIFLFDHFGSTSVDNIINRVRYMAKALNCKYVVVDHISIIVSAQESGDERRAIDEIMTKLRMLVQETGIALFAVSHLKRPDGKGHEEGAATSLAQLRGSGSIAQLSDMVIGAERNGQADDPIERNTTYVRVLKNRFSGQTGPACALVYSKETGRMFEAEEQEAL
jgi:twinkle protein